MSYKRTIISLSLSDSELADFDVAMNRNNFKKRAIFAKWCLDRQIEQLYQKAVENV